ncbi:MAG: hypothetical protein J6Y82_08055 [Bacteroidales bacterium]|nr:hypothetical protein [Bacteroidales bacterium]
MKKQINNFWLAAAAVALVCVTGCKDEDKPSTIPTQPTTMSIENGAEISETKVSLSVSGSTVEDQECNISYDYYIGTSQDNLVKTNPQDINLTPYTQYFWYAKAKTETDESEPTEIRTFYCVPPFEIETDNGDGEWAAVLRFKGLSNINGGKVTLTPDKQGYNYQKEIEIPAGQDSCYIKMGNEHNPTNAAFTHLYDDEHGITYEPIIYTFNATIDVQVGDKSFAVSKEAKEIILDTKHYVHDYEFNVYRLVKIGNQIWTADNFVSSSICLNNKVYNLADLDVNCWYIKYDEDGSGGKTSKGFLPEEGLEGLIYTSSELPSGAKSKVYHLRYSISTYSNPFEAFYNEDYVFTSDIINRFAIPKGFHISTVDDWLEMEKYYGVDIDPTKEVQLDDISNDSITSSSLLIYPSYRRFAIKHLQYGVDVYEGENVEIRSKLSSHYEWTDTAGVAINNTQGPFNSKPFGIGKETIGNGAVYFAYDTSADNCQLIVLTNYLKGLIRKRIPNKFDPYNACIRLVKDK